MDKKDKISFVSIIVPVYNGEATLAACLESLLNLDFPKDKYEIIAVDNNSTDSTEAIIRKCSVKYISEKLIQTSYAARNSGISFAKGDVIAFTDADCVVSGDWLKLAVPEFDDSQLGCVVGGIRAYDPVTWVEKLLADKKSLDQTGKLNHVFMPYGQTANVFFRKDIFDKIGLFQEHWKSGGDADFAWRMQLETSYTLKYVPQAFVRHRSRDTLVSVCKQRARWMYGRIALSVKYNYRTPKINYKRIRYLTKKSFLLSLDALRKKFFGKEFKQSKKDLLMFSEMSGEMIALLKWELDNSFVLRKNPKHYRYRPKCFIAVAKNNSGIKDKVLN